MYKPSIETGNFEVSKTHQTNRNFNLAVAKQKLSSSIKKTTKRSTKAKYLQSKRTSWKSNKLPNKWKELKKSLNWIKLSKLEQQILKLGWPNRYFHFSYNEIATLLDIKKNAAIRLIKKLENIEFIIKKKSFIAKKDGSFTKIHKRNYYSFTDTGKASIEIFINRLFLNVKNEPLKNLTKVRKNKPGENLRPQDYLQSKKSFEIRKSFEKYFFEKQLYSAHQRTLSILLEYSVEKIKKILKLMQKKIQKGWNLRSFWGFFLKQLKSNEKTRSFFLYRANEFIKAANGYPSILTQGVDTNIIVQSLAKLQKTGELISENKLSRILFYGIQKVKIALEGICYRSYLGRGLLPKPKDEIKNLRNTKKQNTLGLEFSKKGKNLPRKEVPIKIRSWIGLLIETLRNCNDYESIHKRYFFSKSY